MGICPSRAWVLLASLLLVRILCASVAYFSPPSWCATTVGAVLANLSDNRPGMVSVVVVSSCDASWIDNRAVLIPLSALHRGQMTTDVI
ncbi:hypothetical protein RRG08_035555 [Elysia crispata]|uniref:Secreted protein n=1 Tax=Elysia crispata TaxID=231223 RepID=A0AAE1B4V2_9GAST|nr:hypothetical protein RRG08_035555 [Elysia crispata]